MNKKIFSIVLFFGFVNLVEASNPLQKVVRKGIDLGNKMGKVETASRKSKK